MCTFIWIHYSEIFFPCSTEVPETPFLSIICLTTVMMRRPRSLRPFSPRRNGHTAAWPRGPLLLLLTMFPCLSLQDRPPQIKSWATVMNKLAMMIQTPVQYLPRKAVQGSHFLLCQGSRRLSWPVFAWLISCLISVCHCLHLFFLKRWELYTIVLYDDIDVNNTH